MVPKESLRKQEFHFHSTLTASKWKVLTKFLMIQVQKAVFWISMLIFCIFKPNLSIGLVVQPRNPLWFESKKCNQVDKASLCQRYWKKKQVLYVSFHLVYSSDYENSKCIRKQIINLMKFNKFALQTIHIENIEQNWTYMFDKI